MLDDRDLVGDGAVEAAQPHGPGAAHGVPEGLGLDLDRQVAPVQPGCGESRLDHRLRRVLLHGLPEEADQLLPEPRHQTA